MKVNLGSGWHYMDGFINVDLYAANADMKQDITAIQFPRGEVEEVHCIHAIEHIDKEAGTRLIYSIAEWLMPSGKVFIETPCRQKCWAMVRAGAAIEDEKMMVAGAKGLLGGRSKHKDEWRTFLVQWATGAAKNNPPEIPMAFDVPGENHVYVWSGGELQTVMELAGLRVAVTAPIHHGARVKRDCRVVGVKP